jgi:hypothetical protein
MLQIMVSLTDDSRGVIYDCKMFTAQVTCVNVIKKIFHSQGTEVRILVPDKFIKADLIFLS